MIWVLSDCCFKLTRCSFQSIFGMLTSAHTGLLWGMSEESLLPAKAWGETGGTRALCCCSMLLPNPGFGQGGHEDRPCPLCHGALTPSAAQHSEAASSRCVDLNRLLGGIHLRAWLQPGPQRATRAYLFPKADSAEFVWLVSALNLSFLLCKVKAWTMCSLVPPPSTQIFLSSRL